MCGITAIFNIHEGAEEMHRTGVVFIRENRLFWLMSVFQLSIRLPVASL